jgi:hypothetical protein
VALRRGRCRECAADALAGRVASAQEWWQLSEGEIHYLWWYVQGSIMEPDVRRRLRLGWGMCGRHAWGALAAEAAFRHNYFHGPAILYQDLMERALRAFEVAGPWPERRLARRLRTAGPCLMCDMGLHGRSRGAAKPELVERGRDLSMIRRFAAQAREFWFPNVCGPCAGESAPARCRLHLLEEIRGGTVGDLALQRALVSTILERITVYARSYRWEYRGTETDRDRSALLSAVGWCSGWTAGLALIGRGARDCGFS